jgi:hypothetical protein
MLWCTIWFQYKTMLYTSFLIFVFFVLPGVPFFLFMLMILFTNTLVSERYPCIMVFVSFNSNMSVVISGKLSWSPGFIWRVVVSGKLSWSPGFIWRVVVSGKLSWPPGFFWGSHCSMFSVFDAFCRCLFVPFFFSFSVFCCLSVSYITPLLCLHNHLIK